MRTTSWIFKTLFVLAIGSTVLITIIGFGGYWYFSKNIPKIMQIEDYKPALVTQVYGVDPRTGKNPDLIAEFHGDETRYIVPYEKIPDKVIKAFISAEDDGFFQHQGVNFASILRASIANFRAGHVVQGGSTITQQVAKSLLLSPEKSFIRKIKELIIASRMEKNLGKKQILFLYLNQIYLGHGSYGIQAASRSYFHKDVSELSIAEAAVLAGMPQAPGKYSPLLNPKRAKERQLYVLRRMYENHFITRDEMSTAADMQIKVYEIGDPAKSPAAYYAEHVRRYLIDKYGEKLLYEGGLTVQVPTTLALSTAAAKSVADGLRQIDKRSGFRGALQKLKPNEIEKFCDDQKIANIKSNLGFAVFTQDGRIDWGSSIAASGKKSEADILKDDKLYKAVVMGIDDKKKEISVKVGQVLGKIQGPQLRWALGGKEEKSVSLNKYFQKGDVLWAGLQKNTDTGYLFALEQQPEVQGALLSIEASTGYVTAMQGGYSFELSQFNRAVQAQRQPGSAFKPFIYSAGVEKGYTPGTIIVDSPIVFEDAESGKWKPANYEEKFYGDTTFRQALIKSRNVPTIKILQNVGVGYFTDFIKRLDLTGKFSSDLSVSLGSGVISLFELSKGYSIFARNGRKISPIFVLNVKDRDGKILEENKPDTVPPLESWFPAVMASSTNTGQPQPGSSPAAPLVTGQVLPFLPSYPLTNDPRQVVDPRVSYVMTSLMKDVVTSGTGYQAKSIGRAAAGKTGTTSDNIDAWFMGFTPLLVTGVWVGQDNLKPIGSKETGARAALPIWLSYMQTAVKGYPDADFDVPPGVVFANIDTVTGKLASASSSQSSREAYIDGTQPTEISSANNPNSIDSGSNTLKEDFE